jgi:hypothetical protein
VPAAGPTLVPRCSERPSASVGKLAFCAARQGGGVRARVQALAAARPGQRQRSEAGRARLGPGPHREGLLRRPSRLARALLNASVHHDALERVHGALHGGERFVRPLGLPSLRIQPLVPLTSTSDRYGKCHMRVGPRGLALSRSTLPVCPPGLLDSLLHGGRSAGVAIAVFQTIDRCGTTIKHWITTAHVGCARRRAGTVPRPLHGCRCKRRGPGPIRAAADVVPRRSIEAIAMQIIVAPATARLQAPQPNGALSLSTVAPLSS